MKKLSIISISIIVISGLLITVPPARGESGPARANHLYTTFPSTLVEISKAGLAIGVREPGSIGGVHMLHTTAMGPIAEGGQYWNQDQPGVDGVAMAGDKFGDRVIWGDFNGDGFPDLAIGTPKDSNGVVDHGSVNVLYGTPEGLSATGSQYLDQVIMNVGMLEMDDLFGFSLAAGDFDNDGYYDLAIGVPGEGIGEEINNGVLDIIYGSDNGLTQDHTQVINQDTPGVYGKPESGDLFGFSLAVGDFDNNGYDDLAVGVPYENFGDDWDSGLIEMLYGSALGLVGRDTSYHQNNIAGDCTAEQGDKFGYALAAGDFDNDGYDDLAIGVPYERFSSIPNVGLVNILYGTSGDFEDRDIILSQNFLEIPGCISDNMDLFGYSLAAGDLNGDGYSDLVIGSPGESQSLYSSGGLNVVYGSATGLTKSSAQWFDQDSPGVYGAKEASDQFGLTLAVSDLNGDGYADLAVGTPYEDFGATRDVGLVQMFFGTTSGLVNSDQWFNQATTGLGEIQSYDMFGISLATWPFPFPYSIPYDLYLPLVLK